MSDDLMLGPGVHEQNAQGAMMREDAENAKVHAILALASAVNRLAAAQENIAAKAGEAR